MIDPATTGIPALLASRVDSPVIIDSSTSLSPETTTPSVTIRISGRTLKWSPYWRSRASISKSAGVSESERIAVGVCNDSIVIDSTAL